MSIYNSKISFTLLFLVFLSSFSFAENPIITQRYSADPSGMEYNGRLYIYASHDIDGQANYTMNDITCISTADMVNWTDHGEVFKVPQNATWASQSWAPSVVARDNKFYLYFGDGNRSVGVAVSDSPTGPFVDAKGSAVVTKSIVNADVPWCYDPSVFVDDDGQAYCYFGGGDPKGDVNLFHGRVVKLGNDMISTVGAAVTIPASGLFEGAHIHKRTVNAVSKYYFSFFRNLSGIKIDYIMSDNPMTGWGTKYTVLNTLPDNMSNNSQAGIFSFLDKWYIAYHNRKLAIDRGVTNTRQRSVCVDEVFYNSDYTMKQVITTSTGPAQIGSVNPFIRNEAETISAQSYLLPGIETNACFDEFADRAVTDIDNGDWVKISGVDFEAGAATFSARVASTKDGSSIEIHLDKVDGNLLAKCNVKNTGGMDKWETVSCALSNIAGKHDLFLKFTGNTGSQLFNFNWWQFSPTNTALNEPIATVKLFATPILGNSSRFKLNKYCKWSIFNSVGNHIQSGESSAIDISTFPKGLYILKSDNTAIKLINQ